MDGLKDNNWGLSLKAAILRLVWFIQVILESQPQQLNFNPPHHDLDFIVMAWLELLMALILNYSPLFDKASDVLTQT